MTMLAIMMKRGDGVLTGAGKLDHKTYLEKAAALVGREISIEEVEVDMGEYRAVRSAKTGRMVRLLSRLLQWWDTRAGRPWTNHSVMGTKATRVGEPEGVTPEEVLVELGRRKHREKQKRLGAYYD